MSERNYGEVVNQLAERFAEDSIGSIDFGVNARAIALRDSKVREQLLAVLERGFRLVRVAPAAGFGSSIREFPLHFSFTRSESDSPVQLEDKVLSVAVDLPTKTVVRIEENAQIGAQQDVPLSLRVPSRAHDIRTPIADLTPSHKRELAFLEGLSLQDILERFGLGGLQGKTSWYGTGYHTHNKTGLGSETWTGDGADDSRNDIVDDGSDDVRNDVGDDRPSPGDLGGLGGFGFPGNR